MYTVQVYIYIYIYICKSFSPRERCVGSFPKHQLAVEHKT